jgi:hypothetical protein
VDESAKLGFAVAAPPRRGGLWASAWPARLRQARLPLLAFIVSRLLVIAAGALGAVRLRSHLAPASVAQAIGHDGPLGYLLSAPVDRWDSGFYTAIATHGYAGTASGRAAFYPLYPWLMRALDWVLGSPVVAGVTVSLIAFVAALVMLQRLTELELGRGAADATVLLIAFAPLSFFFSAVYTESLFLALTVGSLLALRTGRWRIACALAAAACLTRVTGFALLPALAAARVKEKEGPDPGLGWLALLPASFAVFAVALVVDGHSALAMFTAEKGWHHMTVGPVAGLALGVAAGVVGAAQLLRGEPVQRFADGQVLTPAAENLVLMVVVGLALRAWLTCRRVLPSPYTVYGAGALLIVLSSPVAGTPLISADRYILTIFPLWMVAGRWVARRRLQLPAVTLGAALLVFYTAQVAAWAFVA